MSYHYGFIIGLLTLMLLIMVVGWVDGCKVNAINHPYFDGVYMFIPPIYGKIGVYFTIALLTLNHWQYGCIYEHVCKIQLHRISMINKEFVFVHNVNDNFRINMDEILKRHLVRRIAILCQLLSKKRFNGWNLLLKGFETQNLLVAC